MRNRRMEESEVVELKLNLWENGFNNQLAPEDPCAGQELHTALGNLLDDFDGERLPEDKEKIGNAVRKLKSLGLLDSDVEVDIGSLRKAIELFWTLVDDQRTSSKKKIDDN